MDQKSYSFLVSSSPWSAPDTGSPGAWIGNMIKTNTEWFKNHWQSNGITLICNIPSVWDSAKPCLNSSPPGIPMVWIHWKEYRKAWGIIWQKLGEGKYTENTKSKKEKQRLSVPTPGRALQVWTVSGISLSWPPASHRLGWRRNNTRHTKHSS